MTEVTEIMSKGTVVLNQQGKDIFNSVAWLLFYKNERQFLTAWRIWNQNRKDSKFPGNRVAEILKRIR